MTNTVKKNHYPFLQLKVTLRLECRYQVWRRIWIRSNSSFASLHKSIQKAFGWTNCHLHQFSIGMQSIRPNILLVPADEFEEEKAVFPVLQTEEKMRLSQCLPYLQSSLVVYVYDLADNWEHYITLEDTVDTVPTNVPTAEGDTPPEDVGGPSGFADFYEAINDPDDPRCDELRIWAGMDPDDTRWS